MKKAILLIPVLLCFTLKAQEAPRPFELGATLVTVNSLNHNRSPYAKSSVQFVNGLFFRYNFKRVSLRATASYSEYDYAYDDPPSFADGGGIKSHNKNFDLGAGAQISLLKKKDILYAFSDIIYRNIFSTGATYGGIGGGYYNFAQTSNGVGGILGLGCTIPVCKSIVLSPEICYRILADFVQGSAAPLYNGNANKYMYSQSDDMIMARLHLTVRF
jgi:hypothetical protein